MENKLKMMMAGLGLAGLVNLSCDHIEKENMLFECEAGNARVKIIEEVVSRDYDKTRLEVYDKDGKNVLIMQQYANGYINCNDGMKRIYQGEVAKTKK